jgi:hypothetical protein
MPTAKTTPESKENKSHLKMVEIFKLPSGSKLATGRLFGPVVVCALRRP